MVERDGDCSHVILGLGGMPSVQPQPTTHCLEDMGTS